MSLLSTWCRESLLSTWCREISGQHRPALGSPLSYRSWPPEGAGTAFSWTEQGSWELRSQQEENRRDVSNPQPFPKPFLVGGTFHWHGTLRGLPAALSAMPPGRWGPCRMKDQICRNLGAQAPARSRHSTNGRCYENYNHPWYWTCRGILLRYLCFGHISGFPVGFPLEKSSVAKKGVPSTLSTRSSQGPYRRKALFCPPCWPLLPVPAMGVPGPAPGHGSIACWGTDSSENLSKARDFSFEKPVCPTHLSCTCVSSAR